MPTKNTWFSGSPDAGSIVASGRKAQKTPTGVYISDEQRSIVPQKIKGPRYHKQIVSAYWCNGSAVADSGDVAVIVVPTDAQSRYVCKTPSSRLRVSLQHFFEFPVTIVSGVRYQLSQRGLPTDSSTYNAAYVPDVKIYSGAISPVSLLTTRMEQVYPAAGVQKVSCAYEADTAAPLLLGHIQSISTALESVNDANGSWYTPNSSAATQYRINLLTVATWEPNCEMTDKEAKSLFGLCELNHDGYYQRDATNVNLWTPWANQKIYFPL